MQIQIKRRWTGTLLFEGEFETIRDAVLAACAARTDLSGADLSDADLRGAVLRGAVLSGADLRGAVLSGADLRGAVLRGAVLSGADLRGAVLRGADLRGAVLSDADLEPIKADFYMVLLKAIPEIAGLRRALVTGTVDGSTYEGNCACLVGTIANERQITYNKLEGLTPNSDRPAERFFLAIREGDTPQTNQASSIAVDWIDEFVADLRAAHLAVPGFHEAQK
jgi:uncharacterized protein YjbI with pentapeptide repeats